MPNPEQNPEREPSDIYGQMKALEPKYQDLKPPASLPAHPARILGITIYTSKGEYEGLSLREEIKFSNLNSDTQIDAIILSLRELNARLSAALAAPITTPRGPINFCSHCGHPVEACPQGFYCQHCGKLWTT